MLFTNVQLKIAGVFDMAMISVIIAFLFVNLFDTAGTLLGVASRSGLIDSQGNVQNINRVLKADRSASKVEKSPSMGSHNPFDVLKHSTLGSLQKFYRSLQKALHYSILIPKP